MALLKVITILLFSNGMIAAGLDSLKSGLTNTNLKVKNGGDIIQRDILHTVSTAQQSGIFEHKPTPTQKFDHEELLDINGIYWLFWTSNKTHVIFETHVRTYGYVGFGLSSANGQMYPGDVVVGWVHDGKTIFKVSSSSV